MQCVFPKLLFFLALPTVLKTVFLSFYLYPLKPTLRMPMACSAPRLRRGLKGVPSGPFFSSRINTKDTAIAESGVTTLDRVAVSDKKRGMIYIKVKKGPGLRPLMDEGTYSSLTNPMYAPVPGIYSLAQCLYNYRIIASPQACNRSVSGT